MKATRSSSDAGSGGGGTGRFMAAPGARKIGASASRTRGCFMIIMWLMSLALTVMQRAGAFVARRVDQAGCVSSPGTLAPSTIGEGSVESKLAGIKLQVTLPEVLP